MDDYVNVYLEDGQCIVLDYNIPLELSPHFDPKIVAVEVGENVRNLVVNVSHTDMVEIRGGIGLKHIGAHATNVIFRYRLGMESLHVRQDSLIQNFDLAVEDPSLDFRIFSNNNVRAEVDLSTWVCSHCYYSLHNHRTHVCYNNIVNNPW